MQELRRVEGLITRGKISERQTDELQTNNNNKSVNLLYEFTNGYQPIKCAQGLAHDCGTGASEPSGGWNCY